MRLVLWAGAAGAFFFAATVQADEPALTPLPAVKGTLQDVMRLNASCRAFTNGCEICLRTEVGPQCSIPGLACQPKQWRCDDLSATPKQGI